MADVLEPRVSRREYLVRERAAEYRSEWWDGEVVAMTGASRPHNLIVGDLLVALHHQLGDGPCEVYSSDMKVWLDRAYVYPDLVVGCGSGFQDAEEDVLLAPTVLVEVLSPSTERYDRGRKARAYQAIPTLREYLLISQDTLRVEHHRRDDLGGWSSLLLQGPDATIELRSIGCTIPLVDVYRRVFRRRRPAEGGEPYGPR